MAISMNGIKNENEFFTSHYIAAILEDDLGGVIASWKKTAEESGSPTPAQRLNECGKHWLKLLRREENGAESATAFIPALLAALGYACSPVIRPVGEGAYIQVEAEITRSGGTPEFWAIHVREREEGDLLDQPLPFTDESGKLLETDRDVPGESRRRRTDRKNTVLTAEDALNRVIFTSADPPRFILLLDKRQAILIDRHKWNAGRILRFQFSDLFNRREEKTLFAMAAFLHRDCLCPDDGLALIDALDENSHRHAYGVSEDLKYALRECIELLGNEAVRWLREEAKEKVYDGALDPGVLSLECLRYMYRLLFLLYIEARPDLSYVPLKSETYLSGYSLESLRELEMMNLTEEESRNGSYFQQSLNMLFSMIWQGYHGGDDAPSLQGVPRFHEFDINPLKSHLFDPTKTPLLRRVRFRNEVLQKVIRLMSLTRPKSGDRRGRISYAQLGINQLGAVYEALLSYRGFFAETDLYEVKANPNDDELQTAYFITAEEIEIFRQDGVDHLVYEMTPDGRKKLKVYPKGTFIYRMAGRDREKSASYYTPESLTRCLVKYALKELLPGKSADDILRLTVCEPAMGSAAFLNEAVNQLAQAYLERCQEERGEKVPLNQYPAELQRVKMYIADNNVFGVDLNPVAVELAEVSLWLNTISSSAFVPWFGNQLACGNSLVGARRQVYPASQVVEPRQRRGWPGPAWKLTAPRRIMPERERERERVVKSTISCFRTRAWPTMTIRSSRG